MYFSLGKKDGHETSLELIELLFYVWNDHIIERTATFNVLQ